VARPIARDRIAAGDRFDRLVAQADEVSGQRRLSFACDCGKVKEFSISNVLAGKSRSCGCLRAAQLADRNYRHGWAGTSEHNIWSSMLARCANPNDKAFANYGGRGIYVCDRWKKFENFLLDMGPRPAGFSIDRINNDGPYEPTNCRWATSLEQRHNQRPRGQRRPPLPYFGGKQTAARRIVAHLPAHLHYVEPYAGSLAVLLAKPCSPFETVNDRDRELMTFWQVLRDRPAELARVCQLTPHSRAEFEDAEDFDVPDDLELARRVWVRLTQSRAGQLTRTGWRHYVAPRGATGLPAYLDGYVDRMAAAAERLHHVSLEARPAAELIERYGKDPDVLLYVDPPYPGSTRVRSIDGYRYEMRGDDDHRALAELLRACRASVVLSGYPSDLYDRELYPDWYRTAFPSGTGQGAEGWSNRTEVLWSNRLSTPDLFTTGEASA